MSRKIKKKKTAAEAAPVTAAKLGIKEKRLIIILVSAFLAAVLLFGAIFGIILAVKNAGYVIRYGNVGIDEGVANYLASYYKNIYMQSLSKNGAEVEDTEEFWGQIMVNDSTLGDYLRYATENYIRQVVAANYLFDRYTRLSKDDKLDIELAIEEKLEYLAGGSVKSFNEMAEKHGFDFEDFKRATEILYKSWAARAKIFGENGEYMLEFPDELEEFYKGYAHVKLLFVRTESVFELDDNGNRIPDADGNDKTRPLTDEEKSQRLAAIETLKALAAKINSGEATAADFDSALIDYDEGDRTSHAKGYYFNENATYTKSFAEEFERIVKASYELSIGKADYVDCSVGVCFIYRIPRAEGAYVDTSSDWCFSDFFPNASKEMFQTMIEEIAESVETREGWENIDPVAIPYNTDFIARF